MDAARTRTTSTRYWTIWIPSEGSSGRRRVRRFRCRPAAHTGTSFGRSAARTRRRSSRATRSPATGSPGSPGEPGVPPGRTVLGGFSQGTAMTYALGLGRGRPRPAGLIALSGFIPTVDGFELDLGSPLPPIAIGHGTFDPVISVEWSRLAKQQLEEAGADVLYRE